MRPCCTSLLNQDVLRALQDVATNKDVLVKVRLDPDAVALAASYRPAIEHQYWYGPTFSDDLASIPTGVTRHEADGRQMFFSWRL